jgi:nucleotide-binding universal stress UspA family protein
MSEESPSYDDILLPTDGSRRAERAVDHGFKLADLADATVHGLYVVDERRSGETPALSSYEIAVKQYEGRGEDLTEGLRKRAHNAHPDATTEVTHGIPYEEIIGYAEKRDIDVIVMGRSGAGGAEAPHMGSVTDRVLRTTDIPVFTV